MRQGSDLGGLVGYPGSADDVTGAGEGGDQVGGRGGAGARALGGLAVHGRVVGSGGVVSEQVGKAAGAHGGQQALDGGGRGCPAHSKRAAGGGAEAGEGLLRGVAGPLADRPDGACSGRHRAAERISPGPQRGSHASNKHLRVGLVQGRVVNVFSRRQGGW